MGCLQKERAKQEAESSGEGKLKPNKLLKRHAHLLIQPPPAVDNEWEWHNRQFGIGSNPKPRLKKEISIKMPGKGVHSSDDNPTCSLQAGASREKVKATHTMKAPVSFARAFGFIGF